MARVGLKMRSVEGNRLMFWCPGCDEFHQVVVERPAGEVGPCWGYNGNPDAPTFTPSILVTWKEPSDNPDEFDDETKDISRICHSFVTDGRIQFLNDCTHALAGQTVDLPDIEE